MDWRLFMLFEEDDNMCFGNVSKKKTSSIFKPGAKHSNKDCCVCGKEQIDGQPRHLWRYGGYVCSVKCFREIRDKQPKRIANKADIALVKTKLKVRRRLIKKILKLSSEKESLMKEMNDKGIEKAAAFYLGKWIILEDSDEYGLPGYYRWITSPNGKAENSEYAIRFAELMRWIGFFEQEVECIEKFLTSGKCVRYSMKYGKE